MWPLRVALLFHLSLSFLHFSLSDSVSSAVLGSSAKLICQFTPVVDAKNVEIRWFTRSFRPYVHQYKNGEDNYREQMEEFRGRTELIKQDPGGRNLNHQ
ncbi:myelin-oligodendrocyte glycoprotein-like [Xenopus laevis]|uniref:Myelin-oligodendrocyte glycoprotein-like n=1 Tax=Xenopus laevis TaxID=8355 RepID=A0A8J1L5C5_XENLA|nr:myelin-oligodendrocyte glycoprotein-like [Xenopus laevis]XP_041424160.1 myelin-oligodendrocyte glycoprotein-like [Xenopus laevis]